MIEEGLHVNKSKTEEYTIEIHGDERWKKCKVLGSLLDTTHDITRRHGLASSAYKKLERNFKSRSLTQNTKIRIFNAYIGSVFLYNSEPWTLTQALCNKIDSIQRKFLRRVLQLSWPKLISNKKLYEKNNQKPWSETVKCRSLRWLGYVMRMDQETPARKALQEFIKPGRRPVGRPKETWLSYVRRILQTSVLGIDFLTDETMMRDLEIVCQD